MYQHTTIGTQIGLSLGDIVLDGDPAPFPKGAHPQFSAHICCGQMAGWIQMPLGTEVGIGPCRRLCVRCGLSSPLPKKEAEPPIFGPYLLWPNGWMDKDATWYGGRPMSIVTKQLYVSGYHLVRR